MALLVVRFKNEIIFQYYSCVDYILKMKKCLILFKVTNKNYAQIIKIFGTDKQLL